MTKNDIAAVLSEIAVLMELKGENPFKTRAYQSGARIVEGIEEAEITRLVTSGELQTIKGIGEALAQKITELKTTGKLEFYEKLKASIEPGLVDMLQIPGLGPKKIRALHTQLGLASIEALKAACLEGKVASLDGFGEKSQEKILTGITNREAYSKRHLWWDANEIAQPIVEGLRALPQVKRAEAAGSLRRGLETVGDLDFLVAASDVEPVVNWFTSMPNVVEVTANGETKASVRFKSGLQADLRLVPMEQFPFALHHFTGSKDHNVQMRQRALERGLSLSEWGLVPAEGEGTAKEKAEKGLSIKVEDEEGIFRALGLQYIPPELREGMDEIELAEKNEIPRLIELSDIKGSFHNHTTWSDGRNTLEEMVAAAEKLGWEYIGIADHSKSSVQANGLSEERLFAQIAEIRALNATRRYKTHVFAGAEVDILPDGSLDYDDSTLSQLDYVVASVHSSFSQNEETLTARIVKALRNPFVTMLGHVTGRLLLKRAGTNVDLAKIVNTACECEALIEINSAPLRAEMDWRTWRRNRKLMIPCSINTDAHSRQELENIRYGVVIARKALLTRFNIVGVLSLSEAKRYFQLPRASRRSFTFLKNDSLGA